MRDIRSSAENSGRGDRSIRNIPVPANHRRHRVVEEVYEDEAPRKRRRRRGGRWYWLSAVGVVVVAVVAALFLSTVYVGAHITVHPRTQTVTTPSRMLAALNAPPGTLAYQTVSLSRSATTTLQASGTAHVERQASGKVTVYNTYSSASQRLIANTRFAAPDGKIYRTKTSVDVPGMGSAEAVIYADSPGSDYNRSETTRFTIPGFKGDPRYEKFYAESQGSISGGFVGEEPAVAESSLKEAQNAMERALESAVREAVQSGVPEDYVLVPGTLTVVFGELVKGSLSGGSVSVSQQARAQAYVIRWQDLASYVARQTINGYSGEAVAFTDPGEIEIKLSSTTHSSGSIELLLSGTPTIVWQFDPNEIRDRLVGKPKGEFEQIVKSLQPAVASAEARIRPFWQSTFPTNPEKIKITTGTR